MSVTVFPTLFGFLREVQQYYPTSALVFREREYLNVHFVIDY